MKSYHETTTSFSTTSCTHLISFRKALLTVQSSVSQTQINCLLTLIFDRCYYWSLFKLYKNPFLPFSWRVTQSKHQVNVLIIRFDIRALDITASNENIVSPNKYLFYLSLTLISVRQGQYVP